MQIQIENRHNNDEALKIINDKIVNIKEKVQCLQQYVPKLLKKQYDSIQGSKMSSQQMKQANGDRMSQ